MISLFRKIRQKLLQENKVTRYLAYAIGEIFLVVIGILIALQVNTWNEERKSRKYETNFYTAILDDLEKDKAKIDQLNAFYHHRINVLTGLLTSVRNPENTISGEEFIHHVEPLYYNEVAISFDATFDASKSSGAFSQFTNKELLKQMIQYYSEFRLIEDIMTSILRLIENDFEPLMNPLPKNFLSGKSSDLVMAVGGNKLYYEHLGKVKDERNLDPNPVIRDFMQKPEFESYLVGDLGRAFHSIGLLENRLHQIDDLQSKIHLFLHD
jgi:hypothetical protein